MGAPILFPDRGNNVAVGESPDAPLDLEAVSDVIVRGRYVNQRVAVAPMEPHGVAAAPADDGRITVWTSNQFPHYVHAAIAAATGIDKSQLHLITPQVGGGFGGKAGMQHEYTVVTLAAQRLRRAVRWIPTRTEDLQSKDHSRGQVQYAELGCTSDGTFTGLRVRLVGDGGAYPGIGAALPGGTRRMSHGTYDFPAIDFDVAVACTNTSPTGAYRGAGRPEATALLERLVDQASHELGIDPIALREKNLLGDDVFPFTTLTGNEYDSGRYRLPLATAAEAIGYADARAEQAARRERGDTLQLGIGVATYVEITGGGGSPEYGKLEVHADGTATMYCGTLSHGQGHQTAYAMLVSAQTGIPIDRITLIDGDTDLVPQGGGTGGSRSLQIGGSAVHTATGLVVERAKDARRPAARGRRGRHRRRHHDRHRRRGRCSGVSVDLGRAGCQGRRARRRAARRRHGLPGRRCLVPVRRPHRDRRGRHRDGQGARCCDMSRSTTAAPSSTDCSSRASSTAASARDCRRRCTKRFGTTPTATRSPRTSPTTASRPRRRCRASRSIRRKHRRHATRSAPRGSAKRPRSARRRRSRTR